MVDYAKARLNMVDCQLRTNGVTAPAILECFSSVPREAFLDGDLKQSAYVDDDLPLPGGFLMEPLVFARMIEVAKPVPTDTVLNLGDVTGYASAILSGVTGKVVTLEQKPGWLKGAQAQWSAMGRGNIVVDTGDIFNGCPALAPYTLILINGAVTQVPETLLAQLKNSGRLVAVVKAQNNRTGEVTLVEKDSDGVYSHRAIFDASVPYLPGCEPPQTFKF
ncbi:MAG TPA: protein-L-isoaspartate O-methyltransferase [Patescibacteria group bacterium]|nr:protein-L-isoaspartate O-methyltransferase [Patescibacteria group bacterium]